MDIRRDALVGAAKIITAVDHKARSYLGGEALEERLHGVHALDQIGGVQQIGLARAGRGTAHVDAAYGAGLGQNGGATGRAARVSEMANLDTLHQGDRAAGGKWGCG